MQRAILILPCGGYVICQGLHCQHSDDLDSLLRRYHGSREAAELLVTGNRISSMSQEGIPERNTFKHGPRRYRSVLNAMRRQECITAHIYTDRGWTYVGAEAALATPTLTLYSDPAHAWLRVNRAAADAIMRDQFKKLTPFSYQRAEWIYLEEDQDAGTFLASAADRGINFQVVSKHTNNRSRIRTYDSLT